MPKKKTKKHIFTKKNVDNALKNIFFNQCVVSMTKLTAEDIVEYKLSLIKNKNISSKQNGDAVKNDETSEDDKKSKCNNTSIDDESPNKKQNLDTDRIDNSSDKNIKLAVDTKKIINGGDDYFKHIIAFEVPHITESFSSNEICKHQKNGMNELEVTKLSTSRPETYFRSAKVNEAIQTLNEKKSVILNLIEIEKLYEKYFNEFVYDTIVIIANIIIVILKSNEHHTERQLASLEKISKYKKLKERYDVDRFHERNNKILDIKLKKNFIDATSCFAESEFGSAFIMFILSILSVLQALDLQRFKREGIVKLIELLQKNLIISENDHPKIFSMLYSKTFDHDCMNVRRIIEDGLDTDLGVIDRMPLYYVETINGKYFQPVIDAVTTSDSNENLALLIDKAIFQCRINSGLKDPVDSLTVQQSNGKIPATQYIQSPINSDKTIKHLSSASNTDGAYPNILLLSGDKSSSIIGNTTVKPSIKSQPFNSFYNSHDSTLQKKVFESYNSKMLPIKKRIIVTPTISNISVMQVPASREDDNDTYVLHTQPSTDTINAPSDIVTAL